MQPLPLPSRPLSGSPLGPPPWHRALLGSTVVAAGLLVGACGPTDAAPAGPSIVCTTVMVGDVVRGVAGDGARVTVLFGADVDPHLFRPTRDDVAALTSADVIFASGLHLEANLIPTLDKLAGEGIAVTYLAESILEPGEELTEGGDVVDPHVWMDPQLWSRTAAVVANALAKDCKRTDSMKGRKRLPRPTRPFTRTQWPLSDRSRRAPGS